VGEAVGWAAEEGAGDPLVMAVHGLSRLAEQPKVEFSLGPLVSVRAFS
jgi:hypothetical protein